MQLRIATIRTSALRTKDNIRQTITTMTRRSVLLTSRERATRRRTLQTTTVVTTAANMTMIKTALLTERDTTKPTTITSEVTATGTTGIHTGTVPITPETAIGTTAAIPLSRWAIRMA